MTVDALAAARRLAPRFAARAAGHDRDGTFPADDFADLRESGLFGLMVPAGLGGADAAFAEYAAVATELARGNGATALVFNMHASVTGALGAVTEELAEALGVPDEALAARDRLLRAAAEGAWYAVAMSERGAGCPAVPAQHASTSRSTAVAASRAARRSAPAPVTPTATWWPPAAPPTRRWSPSSWCRPGDGLTVEPTWDALGMRATSSHDLHLDVTVPADRLLGGVEGLALVVAQLMPHWLVASYAAVYVGVARAAVDAAVEHLNARGPGRPAGGPGPARPGRRGGGGGPAGGRRGGPPGRRGARRRGDQPLGVAGEAARRHHRGGGGGVHAGGGRHLGDPPRASAGTALPGRPLRLAAPGDLGRVRRLARASRRSAVTRTATERPRVGERAEVGVAAGRAVSDERWRQMAVPVIAGLGTAQPPSAAQDELWEGYFAEHYAGSPRGPGRADLRQLRGAHPAGGGQPAAGGRLRLVRPSAGCGATRSRRCRWARRRSAGR